MKIVLIRSDEGWSVSAPSLPGCHSQGRTEAKDDLEGKDLEEGAEVREIELIV